MNFQLKNKELLGFHKKGLAGDTKDHMETEMIYANSNVIGCSEVDSVYRKVKNISVPSGRKPALPPKPPKRLGFVHNACVAIFDRKSPQNRKDPAEMSLKERLALFEEKNKASTPNEYCRNGGEGQSTGTCFERLMCSGSKSKFVRVIMTIYVNFVRRLLSPISH